MKRTSWMGALAPMLLLPLALELQGQGGQQGHTGQDKWGGQTQDPMAEKQKGRVLVDADSVVGRNVVNRQGEDLGRIDDLVLDQQGRISYAVLSFGGWLGMGDKLFAVPFDCMEIEYRATAAAGVGRDPGTPVGDADRPPTTTTRPPPSQAALGRNAVERIVLHVERERLRQAPGFDRDNWPSMGNLAWCAEVDQFYAQDMGRMERGRAREAGARIEPPNLILRLGDLKRETIEGREKENIGRISRLVIEPNLGRVAYAVVGVGGFLGIGSKDVAVPFQAIQVTRTGEDMDDLQLRMTTTKEQLERAPEFDEKDPKVYDPAFLARLYTYYGVQPTWMNEMGTDPALKRDHKDPKDGEQRRDH